MNLLTCFAKQPTWPYWQWVISANNNMRQHTHAHHPHICSSRVRSSLNHIPNIVDLIIELRLIHCEDTSLSYSNCFTHTICKITFHHFISSHLILHKKKIKFLVSVQALVRVDFLWKVKIWKFPWIFHFSNSEMFTHNKQIEWLSFLLLALLIGTAICTPMYYKKTDEETYEPGEYFSKRNFFKRLWLHQRYKRNNTISSDCQSNIGG